MNQQDAKLRILLTAKELFAKQGFDGTSVRQIAVTYTKKASRPRLQTLCKKKSLKPRDWQFKETFFARRSDDGLKVDVDRQLI
ncbi:TetR family transcriptional regulator [Paenibacillus periandrae]|uniref:TetR family transcriptional regulator n=1 Tax=Paenibacillus periandrae TaxID=1761741 RepID=UPI001F089312|nr:TetR family transcriptional regulator [Paenibacillus periandrae]